MSEHTPGPWKLHRTSNRQEIWDKDAVVIAVVPIYHAIPRGSKANAHLIAAAPDLLAALKEMVGAAQYFSSDGHEGYALQCALDALDKADGR